MTKFPIQKPIPLFEACLPHSPKNTLMLTLVLICYLAVILLQVTVSLSRSFLPFCVRLWSRAMNAQAECAEAGQAGWSSSTLIWAI